MTRQTSVALLPLPPHDLVVVVSVAPGPVDIAWPHVDKMFSSRDSQAHFTPDYWVGCQSRDDELEGRDRRTVSHLTTGCTEQR